jgi:hypothetical protein
MTIKIKREAENGKNEIPMRRVGGEKRAEEKKRK